MASSRLGFPLLLAPRSLSSLRLCFPLLLAPRSPSSFSSSLLLARAVRPSESSQNFVVALTNDFPSFASRGLSSLTALSRLGGQQSLQDASWTLHLHDAPRTPSLHGARWTHSLHGARWTYSLHGAPRTPSLHGAGQAMTFSTSSVLFWSPGPQKGHDGLKFKVQRLAKFQESFNGQWILPLPDYQKAREIRKADSYRLGIQKMKRDGMLPPRQFNERPIDISSSVDVYDPYIPPEGDGVKTLLSKEGSKEKAYRARMWTKTKNAIRKLNKMEKDTGGFAAEYFSEEAVDLYVEAHQALVKGNRVRLHELVTSKCYGELMSGLEYKTLRWRYHEAIEPPRVVNASLFSNGPEGNNFAQITVRIHSSQSVAIYDRFGRLAYGDPDLLRSVLEFVVFEKRTSDTYGTWRMHGKIEPEWVDAKPPVKKTFRIPEHEEIKPEDLEKMSAKELDEEEDEEGREDLGPRPATA